MTNDEQEICKALIKALTAKVESLAADAERYQWLRQNKEESHYVAIHITLGYVDALVENDLDAAIDAAMAKEKA